MRLKIKGPRDTLGGVPLHKIQRDGFIRPQHGQLFGRLHAFLRDFDVVGAKRLELAHTFTPSDAHLLADWLRNHKTLEQLHLIRCCFGHERDNVLKALVENDRIKVVWA